MSASRMVQKSSAMILKTSLCYNPDLERLTISIYDLKGLEARCHGVRGSKHLILS